MALKELRNEGLRIKGDERILGRGDFVEDVLRRADEEFEAGTRAISRGITVPAIMARVADHYGVDLDDLREFLHVLIF